MRDEATVMSVTTSSISPVPAPKRTDKTESIEPVLKRVDDSELIPEREGACRKKRSGEGE